MPILCRNDLAFSMIAQQTVKNFPQRVVPCPWRGRPGYGPEASGQKPLTRDACAAAINHMTKRTGGPLPSPHRTRPGACSVGVARGAIRISVARRNRVGAMERSWWQRLTLSGVALTP